MFTTNPNTDHLRKIEGQLTDCLIKIEGRIDDLRHVLDLATEQFASLSDLHDRLLKHGKALRKALPDRRG